MNHSDFNYIISNNIRQPLAPIHNAIHSTIAIIVMAIIAILIGSCETFNSNAGTPETVGTDKSVQTERYTASRTVSFK